MIHADPTMNLLMLVMAGLGLVPALLVFSGRRHRGKDGRVRRPPGTGA